ncbi:MAG: IS5 family transposase [Chitinophagaceae bacterium]|nr:IS5 family transposase [Chitinophagaceae bacterium]
MRGAQETQVEVFSYLSMEDRVPKNHPIRPFKVMVNELLKKMDGDFNAIYADIGRPSIAPEYLMRASILQVLYSIRSERQLMEQLDYNILFRWFVGIGIDAQVWDHSTFTKNRDRLLQSAIAKVFFTKVGERAEQKKYLSDDHFTVDGSLLEAWASMKSFQEKEGGPTDSEGSKNPDSDFHGQKRSNDTHESKTDPDARLYKKSKGAASKLAYLGHVLMENRNGLAVDVEVTQANGTAEREAAISMLDRLPGTHRRTLGADKGYAAEEFVEDLRARNVTPHIAQKKNSQILDKRTTRHEGYEVSLRKRKRVEEIFGWGKTVGLIRKLKVRGLEKVQWLFILCIAVYNLVRMRNMEAEA